MAYRELGVIELRVVLRRFTLGEGLRAIARGTGVDRKTVGKYVAAGLAGSVVPGWRGPDGGPDRGDRGGRPAAQGGSPRRHGRPGWLGWCPGCGGSPAEIGSGYLRTSCGDTGEVNLRRISVIISACGADFSYVHLGTAPVASL